MNFLVVEIVFGYFDLYAVTMRIRNVDWADGFGQKLQVWIALHIYKFMILWKCSKRIEGIHPVE